MSNLREKYKPTAVKVLKKVSEQEDAAFNSGRGQFLQFTEGKNRIRFLPPHDSKSTFYTLRAFFWMKNYADDDSGDETFNRTCLNARFHYPGAKFDLVDEYVAFARAFIESNDDLEPAEKAAKMEIFSNWKTGIQLSRSWVAYALKINGDKREFGLIELNKTLRDKINQEVMLEDDDDPIETDPFTHPDEGRIVIVFFDKAKAKADQRYSIKVGKAEPLTDEELEQLDSAKPLAENFIYTSRDWDVALEGLKIFDETNDIDLFAQSDWQARIKEVHAQFNFGASSKKPKEGAKKATSKHEDDDDDDDEDDRKPAPKKPAAAPPSTKQVAKKQPVVVVEEDEDEEEPVTPEVQEEDDFEGMDREQLKMWIVERHESDPDSVEVLRVKKSMSDDDIRKMIRKHISTAPVEDEDEEDEDEESPAPTSKKSSAPAAESKTASKSTTLAEVKARLAAKLKK